MEPKTHDLKFAVLCSGRGSNFNSILEACKKDEIKATPIALITNNEKAKALDLADSHNLTKVILPSDSSTNRDNFLIKSINELKPDFIILAGYLKLVPKALISQYHNRILNIHPALLPEFGGKGMYGINVHKGVIEARASHSGATVHLVTDEYDKGEVILQERVNLSADETPESLAAKVLKVEHELYPKAISAFLRKYFGV